MEEKLFISDEALKKYGYAEFRGCEYEDYQSFADDDFTELENGLLVTRDDMGNIYLCANEYDESFSDIEDITNKIELAYMAKFFNMKAVCEKIGMKYETYRNFANGRSFAEKTAVKLLKAMKEISNDIEIKEED